MKNSLICFYFCALGNGVIILKQTEEKQSRNSLFKGNTNIDISQF